MAQPPLSSATTVLRADWLIDGTGRAAISDGAVALQGDRIVAVGTREEIGAPEGAQIQEFPGCSLLPGLVDSHVHLNFSSGLVPFKDLEEESDDRLLLRSSVNARQALMAGVTTLRDLGCRNHTVLALRDAINAGLLPGP